MKRFSLVLLASMLMVSVAFVSCSKDDDDDNNDDPKDSEFTYEEVSYDLASGVLEYYGEWVEGAFNYDVTLFSSGITYDPTQAVAAGVGEVVYFEMYSSSATELMEGTYNFAGTEAPMTFDIGDFIINADIDNETSDHNGELASGSVVVEKDGSTYMITFTGVDTDGKAMSGYYEGSLVYVDWSSTKAASKKHNLVK